MPDPPTTGARREGAEGEQINRWANRALENLYGGWLALTEHQLTLIIEATGGLDPETAKEREALRIRLGDVQWSEVYAVLQPGGGGDGN